MTMRSPIVAMLWEIWRLTRVEAAWKLALGIVGGSAVLALFAAFAPDDNASVEASRTSARRSPSSSSSCRTSWGGCRWRSSMAVDPAFRFISIYTRPVRTAVIVGLPMAYLTALSSAIYLVSALLLRVTSGYAFPLLPVAAWIAALTLVLAGGELVDPQQVHPGAGDDVCHLEAWLGLAMHRLTAVEIPDSFDWPPRLWPTLFDFPLTDYA